MKILILSQAIPYPEYADGLTVRLYNIIKEFAALGCDCELIAFRQPGLSEDDILNFSCMVRLFSVEMPRSGPGIRSRMKQILSARRYWSKEFSGMISSRILQFDPDVVLFEQAFMAQYIDDVEGRPCIMSAVDAISLAARRQSQMSSSLLKRFAYRIIYWQRLWLERKYYKKFPLVTITSKEDGAHIEHMTGVSPTVIPNGVDGEYFSPSAQADCDKSGYDILFTGNLYAPMNDEAARYLCLHVAEAVLRNYPFARFVIAGRRPSDALIAEASGRAVIFDGLEDLRVPLKQATIFVCPIKYGTGIKNNVLQAMSMGLPVVVPRLIAEPIGISHGVTGIICERGQGFIEALSDALSGRYDLVHIGEQARLYTQRYFSWRAISEKYLLLFDQVITEGQMSEGKPRAARPIGELGKEKELSVNASLSSQEKLE